MEFHISRITFLSYKVNAEIISHLNTLLKRFQLIDIPKYSAGHFPDIRDSGKVTTVSVKNK